MKTGWERQPTWRELVESGQRTWNDYVQYRLRRLDTETMEYRGYDQVWHTYTFPLSFLMKCTRPQEQGYITIK